MKFEGNSLVSETSANLAALCDGEWGSLLTENWCSEDFACLKMIMFIDLVHEFL